MDNLTSRCAWAIKIIPAEKDLDFKITDVALAKILGTDKNTLSRYRREKGPPAGKVIDSLIARYKFNPTWLFKKEGEPFPGARNKYPEVCGLEESVMVREVMGEYDPQISKEFVFIKQVSGKISAGGGLVPDDSGDMRLAFRKEWFKKKGDPKNMSLIKVSGDSMEPTLLSGDLVLVDHSRNTIASQDGIYAISIDHEILIKRLHLLYQDSKILVISDNKQYPPQEIGADKITINGKVIWYAREIER